MTQGDSELLARIALRDALAFEQLCAQYQAPLRRHLLRIMRTPEVADDLLQDTFARHW